MRITETVSDRTQVGSCHIDVEIEVEHIAGTSSDALEVTERLETVVKEEIKDIAAEDDDA